MLLLQQLSMFFPKKCDSSMAQGEAAWAGSMGHAVTCVDRTHRTLGGPNSATTSLLEFIRNSFQAQTSGPKDTDGMTAQDRNEECSSTTACHLNHPDRKAERNRCDPRASKERAHKVAAGHLATSQLPYSQADMH